MLIALLALACTTSAPVETSAVCALEMYQETCTSGSEWAAWDLPDGSMWQAERCSINSQTGETECIRDANAYATIEAGDLEPGYQRVSVGCSEGWVLRLHVISAG